MAGVTHSISNRSTIWTRVLAFSLVLALEAKYFFYSFFEKAP